MTKIEAHRKFYVLSIVKIFYEGTNENLWIQLASKIKVERIWNLKRRKI